MTMVTYSWTLLLSRALNCMENARASHNPLQKIHEWELSYHSQLKLIFVLFANSWHNLSYSQQSYKKDGLLINFYFSSSLFVYISSCYAVSCVIFFVVLFSPGLDTIRKKLRSERQFIDYDPSCTCVHSLSLKEPNAFTTVYNTQRTCF